MQLQVSVNTVYNTLTNKYKTMYTIQSIGTFIKDTEYTHVQINTTEYI